MITYTEKSDFLLTNAFGKKVLPQILHGNRCSACSVVSISKKKHRVKMITDIIAIKF